MSGDKAGHKTYRDIWTIGIYTVVEGKLGRQVWDVKVTHVIQEKNIRKEGRG